MAKLTWLISLLVLTWAQASLAGDQVVKEQMKVPMTAGPSVSVYTLTARELQFHMSRALMGDKISGYCLAVHYAYVEFRDPDADYWITIAAENGNATAMTILALRLAARNGSHDASRAEFWKNRAAKVGDSAPAQSRCHELDD